MTIVTKVQGLGEVNKVLRQLPDEIAKKALRKAARKGAVVIRNEIKSRVPRGIRREGYRILKSGGRSDYGRLYDQIKVTALRGNSKDEAVMLIHTGTAYWAIFLEFGTSKMSARPFMRPALDEAGQKAVLATGLLLGKTVEDLARKLSGKYEIARKVLR